MTIEQTRQLGIEFERRVQIMIPEKELLEKLDTETIYSFLNQYQDKFVHDIYKQVDKVESPSNISAYVESILNGLLKTYTKNIGNGDKSMNNQYSFELPSDFGLYVNSSTVVSDIYSYKDKKQVPATVQNTLIPQSKITEFLQTANDSMRIIRKPILYISGNNILMACDRYTVPQLFNLTYYKIPAYMNLMTYSKCELPIDAFEDLVSGAVDLYVQYVAGAEARRTLLKEQAKNRAREDERDARRYNKEL